MKKIFLFSFLLTLNAYADFASVKGCIQSNYQNVQGYNAIATAVVSSEKIGTMTFFKAKIDQLFEIGSLTKTMTGTLLAKTVLENKIKLSDPIPEAYQKSPDKITYKHLATHTAGFTNAIADYYQVTNEKFPYEGLTKEKFKELYPLIKLESLPGKNYLYSNTGVSLLGLLLEEIYQEPYESLIQKNIFDVLGMKNTYFEVPASQMSHFPEGNVNGQIWPYWDIFKTAFNPAGGVRSTISDMALYAQASLKSNNTEFNKIKETAQAPLFQRDHRWMAMNWITNPELGLVWHDGSTIAFNSYLIISKEKNLAIVMMTDTGLYDEKNQFDFSLQDIVVDCLLYGKH